MLTAIILIVVTLILILTWMIVITILYMNLAKSFKAMRKALDAVPILDKNQESMLKALDTVIDFFDSVSGEAESLYQTCADVLELATEKAAHARDTVQAARRIRSDLINNRNKANVEILNAKIAAQGAYEAAASQQHDDI